MSQGTAVIIKQRLQLFLQTVHPAGDRAGAKPDHRAAGLHIRRHGGGEIGFAVDGDDIAMAMGAQRLGIGIPVDAVDRLFARGIDRRDDRDIGIVQAFGELLERVAQPCIAMRLHHRHAPGRYRPGARLASRRRS